MTPSEKNMRLSDYKYAAISAALVLKTFSIRTAPVDLNIIVSGTPQLNVDCFSRLINKYGCSEKDLRSFFCSRSGVIAHYEGRSLILINDTRGGSGTIRFTAAHELGHFFLAHDERYRQIAHTAGKLRSREYTMLEREADCFALNLLSPAAVAEKLLASLPPGAHIRRIMSAFSITERTAVHRLAYLKRDAGNTAEYADFFSIWSTNRIEYSKDDYTFYTACPRKSKLHNSCLIA